MVLGFVDVIPQADHDFETSCFGSGQYGTRHFTGGILDRFINLRICPDNGLILSVGIELF